MGSVKYVRIRQKTSNTWLFYVETYRRYGGDVFKILEIILPGITVSLDIICFGAMTDNTIVNTIANSIISIARWQIWKRRCSNKYDNTLLPIDVCLSNVMRGIFDHMHILRKKQNHTTLALTVIKWVKERDVKTRSNLLPIEEAL